MTWKILLEYFFINAHHWLCQDLCCFDHLKAHVFREILNSLCKMWDWSFGPQMLPMNDWSQYQRNILPMSRNEPQLRAPCSVPSAHATPEKPGWSSADSPIYLQKPLLAGAKVDSVTCEDSSTKDPHTKCWTCQEKYDSLVNKKENKRNLKIFKLKIRYVNFRWVMR